jgi:polysaccharide biosynthesis transport protein
LAIQTAHFRRTRERLELIGWTTAMLHSNLAQNNRALTLLDGALPLDQAEENGLGDVIDAVLGFLRRQYLLIVFTAMLGLAASVGYLRVAAPTYTAHAKVLFGNPKAQFVQQQSLLAETPVDVAQIESQIEILKSKAIASAVIDKLALAADPDFRAPPPSWRSKVKTWLGGPLAGSEPDPADRLLEEFEKRFTAERLGHSTVIELTFSASNAERAAEIANTIANTYISEQLSAKLEANRAATAWLHDRLKDLGNQALSAERSVNEFKSENNIVAASGKLMDEEQVADLNNRLVAARAQASEAAARVGRLQAVLAADSTDSGSISGIDASGSDVLNSPIINSLRQQYFEFARREFEWSARFGKDHTAVVNIRTEMKAIRASILDEVRRLAEIAKNDLELAKQRQQQIESQLAQAVSQSRTAKSAELTMRELENNAKGYRSLYESFLQRYMGSVQQESFPISEARLISPAAPPQSKSKPKSALVLALGMIGGIALGAAFGFLRDIMDRVFRTSAQIEATLQLPCLSLVPLLKASEQRKLARAAAKAEKMLARAGAIADKESGPRTLSRKPAMYWAASSMPLSRFAESIRSVKVAIDLNSMKASNKVIGITSALPSEGKSTIAVSLAQIIAHPGKRTIIVDCDLRNPSLSTTLTPNATAALTDVLSGARSLEETVWRDAKTGLVFLPAAVKGPLSYTSEVLSGAQTRKLFDQLRAAYDYVVVDLPPLAPIVDVRATTPLIDCFILVVEWGRTSTDVVQHALHTAPNVHEAVVGTVLNKTDMKAIQRYDHYSGQYYNNEHFVRYAKIAAN